MGLDQYAYKIKKGLVEDTIDIKLWDEEKGEPLHEYDSDFFITTSKVSWKIFITKEEAKKFSTAFASNLMKRTWTTLSMR